MVISIPAFHVSDHSKLEGSGEVFVSSRKSGANSGVFKVAVNPVITFDPPDYPIGGVVISADLFDSATGTFISTSIDLINSHGKYSPTVALTGRCKGDISGTLTHGLRFWLMVVDNNSVGNAAGTPTPDIVSFAVHDLHGDLVAYGTGPVRAGNFKVSA